VTRRWARDIDAVDCGCSDGRDHRRGRSGSRVREPSFTATVSDQVHAEVAGDV
jgi:hypothetical protein